jgi:hypothetical protein
VVVVISNNVVFERGSDLEPLRLTDDCRCRFYHIRFPLNPYETGDDIRQLLKGLQPKTFTITTGRDLREAVAEIGADVAAF